MFQSKAPGRFSQPGADLAPFGSAPPQQAPVQCLAEEPAPGDAEVAAGAPPGDGPSAARAAPIMAHWAEDGPAAPAAGVQAAARHGTSGAGGALPHLDAIQRAFGRHDVSGVKAHTGAEAAAGARAMGAEAFATGDRVAFSGAPSLHTAAHEAAHVIQQRGGVQLRGGVGQAGDGYERHADEVADRVGAGQSAEGLLDRMAGPGGAAPGAVQRKPGVTIAEGQGATEAVALFRQVYTAYHGEMKEKKQAAIEAFSVLGKMDDAKEQTAFTLKLRECQMTDEGLVRALRQARFHVEQTKTGWQVKLKGQPVAAILAQGNAFVQVKGPTEDTAPIYQKHTLDGMSEKEYVKIHGQMLRRHAYRGITPPERKAFAEGADLRPLNAGRRAHHAGFTFTDEGLTKPRERHKDKVRDGKTVKEDQSDVAWLNRSAGTAHDQLPDDRQLLAFAQTRKGVGRAFSATATARPITSNHGKPFTAYGRIQIDLAKVPEASILHHYKEQFDAGDLARRAKANTVSGTLKYETERGNETVFRNRELIMDQIPRGAVKDLEDTSARAEYVRTFEALKPDYVEKARAQYLRGYQEVMERAHLDQAPKKVPELLQMSHEHYGKKQAEADLDAVLSAAMDRGRQDAQPIVDAKLKADQAKADTQAAQTLRQETYEKAYLAAYQPAWHWAYKEGVEDKWQEDEKEGSVPEFDPPPPKSDLAIGACPPQGDPGALGKQAGQTAGKDEGWDAGQLHDFSAKPESAAAITTSSDAEEKETEPADDAPRSKKEQNPRQQKNQPKNKGGKNKAKK